MKYDKIWGYHNEGVPLKRDTKKSNFLIRQVVDARLDAHARRIKFSG